jgi:LDH2 family malate/lactate/ureidoglycolate dehydrogenase
MNEGTIYLPVATVQQFMIDVFAGLGVPIEDARLTSDVLITADVRGIKSHGIGRLKYYYDRIKRGQHQPVTQFEVVREGPTTALVDGHHGMGHVIGVKAMQLAIDKARAYGMGSVAVRNSTHFGIAGYYPLMAVNAGMAGMTFTNARPAIAPTFGTYPMLGTNPIAFGAPTDEAFPYLFDGATSIVQRGTYEVLERAEQPGEPGWAIDRNGEDITDAKQLLDGLDTGEAALLPLGGAGESFAGYKGYDLATMVEILSASLSGGAFMKDLLGYAPDGARRPFMIGHFFLAIDIEHFVPVELSKSITGGILRALQAARKAPGQDRIYVAGEKEFEKEQEVRQHGIRVNHNLLRELQTMRDELAIAGFDAYF